MVKMALLANRPMGFLSGPFEYKYSDSVGKKRLDLIFFTSKYSYMTSTMFLTVQNAETTS